MAQVKKQHWLLRLWIKVRGFLALCVVLAGVTVGVLSLLLPFESLYQSKLEKFLQQQWGMDVQLGEVDGSWQGYGPYFLLSDLKLTGKQSIQLKSADLSINVYQLLIPGGRTGIDLSVNKAELDMIHSAEGANITINNAVDETRFTDMLDNILTTGSLRVDEMMLNLANDEGEVLLEGLKADLLLEQDETHRALQLLVENESSEAHVEIKSKGLKTRSLTHDANWYIKFSQFSLDQINDLIKGLKLPVGVLDGALWLTADSGAIVATNGQLSWRNSSQDFSFDITLKQLGQEKDWQANLLIQNLKVYGDVFDDFNIQLQKDGGILKVRASVIPVPLIIRIIADMNLTDASQFNGLSQVEGQLLDLSLSYDMQQKTWLPSDFKYSGMSFIGESNQLVKLAGEFSFNQVGGKLLIDSQDGLLSMPDIFRGQLQWQYLSSQIDINWGASAPLIDVNNLWCQCNDFNLQLWSNAALDKVVNLKLNSRLSEVDVPSLSKYWPHQVWKPKTIEWLDRSLFSGLVKTGFVFVHGDMVHKAFQTGKADFISRAYTSDIDNKFHPDWPVVNGIDAVAVFDHDQVFVAIEQAETMGMKIQEAQVDIASFDDGILSVELNASSENNEILNYVQASPLAKNLTLNNNIKVGGQQQIELAFDVSIKADVKQTFEPKGHVEFSEGMFLTEHFTINEINGPVLIDGYQILMNDLPAKLSQAAVKLNGEIMTKSADGFRVDVNLAGSLGADYLLEVIQQDLPISGESEWLINIKTKAEELMMTAESSLNGVSIQLPAPLDKTVDQEKNLKIECTIPCQESMVEINYNDQIKSTLSREAGSYHLSQLQFLDETLLDSTDESLFGGQLGRLDLDRWLSLLANKPNDLGTASESKGGWPVNEINLTINQMLFMSREFNDIKLHIKRLANGYEINVDSSAIKGKVSIDDNIKQKGIVAEFEHLNWFDALSSADNNLNDSSGSAIPDIHLWAEEFSYANVPLGELRMEMRNVADGIKVEQLSLKSDLAEVNISGAWNKAEGEDGYSNFNVVMFSEKIADFLQTVGFSAPITNAQTLIEMEAQWSGVPSQFNIANIDGNLNIKIGEGQVLDQQPGFGRVLGLFNLTNLPRRLILDFSDVLADGLLFRSMEGHFVIKSGVANTQDFLIKASSAKIQIRGDVGFADQSYDQTITVIPQIGKTFPTLGAIAGGPVGAAAGFLVQGIFDKQLKNKNEIIYQVTGTWDEPLIELISDE